MNNAGARPSRSARFHQGSWEVGGTTELPERSMGAREMKRRRPTSRVMLNAVAVWRLLNSRGISQNALARLVGISSCYMSDLTSHAEARLDLLHQLVSVRFSSSMGPGIHRRTRVARAGRIRNCRADYTSSGLNLRQSYEKWPIFSRPTHTPLVK